MDKKGLNHLPTDFVVSKDDGIEPSTVVQYLPMQNYLLS